MKNSEYTPVSTKGFLVSGNSCSCGSDERQILNELSTVRREQYYAQLNLTGNFEQQLTLCNSIKDYIYTLQEFVYLIRDVTGVYLCLKESWYSYQTEKLSSDECETEDVL